MHSSNTMTAAMPRDLVASLVEYAARFADSNNEPSGGDCRRTIERVQELLTLPAEGSCRYPNLEDTADRVFHAEHNFRSSYSLCWKAADDAAARSKLRELNIRPGHISRREPGEESHATRLGCDVFVCLITSAAHRKLRDASALVSRIVLD